MTRFHGDASAAEAEAAFDRVHVQGELPSDIEEASFEPVNGVAHLPLVMESLFGMSRSEARRLLAQGGVKIDGAPVAAAEQDVPAERLDGAVLQVGRRRFRRLRRA